MLRTATALIALIAAMPALAQTAADPTLPNPNDQSDTFTIAAGGALVPDYEGSNDYEFTPFGAIRGRVSGMSFFSRGTYLYLDVVRRPTSGIDFDAGPIVGVRRERINHTKDDFVDALPNRKTAFEVGGFAGVTFHGLTNPYDALSIRLDVVHDIGNAHESTIVTPNIDFGTPLSKRTYIGASLSADFVSNRYADYYYGISPAEGFIAGLPADNPHGGMKNWKLSTLINQSITGDLTHGLSIFGAGSYSRIVGSIADSPIVDDRGSRSQWQAALGLAYTF
ncbi:MipA/OmpV family protein [Sphingomonas sp.]|uniref:MipA/OmpV family protein n=1 Tax=Sphingomonas sp. TaxID=28214 RepID=UPI00286C82E0|nr:MipA/OmpV family protein [Sphingomonas sp.]